MKFTSESLGTMLPLAAGVGSGIMGEALAQGNLAVALLANASGHRGGAPRADHDPGPAVRRHFNPAVSLIEALRAELRITHASAYVLVQITGCCVGAFLAHAMFELPLIQASGHLRAVLRND